MPYILIEKKVGFGEAISEIEIITTSTMYFRIVNEHNFLPKIRAYIMKAAEKRPKLGADSKEAKKEKIKKCCDRVDGCTRAFHVLVMEKEMVEHSNLN
jgi:hypothetical protein